MQINTIYYPVNQSMCLIRQNNILPDRNFPKVLPVKTPEEVESSSKKRLAILLIGTSAAAALMLIKHGKNFINLERNGRGNPPDDPILIRLRRGGNPPDDPVSIRLSHGKHHPDDHRPDEFKVPITDPIQIKKHYIELYNKK